MRTRIIHARSAVEHNNAPYVGRYIAKQIYSVPAGHPQSRTQRIPNDAGDRTNPFLKHAFQMIHGENYPAAVPEDLPAAAIDSTTATAYGARRTVTPRLKDHSSAAILFDGTDTLLTEVLRNDAEL